MRRTARSLTAALVTVLACAGLTLVGPSSADAAPKATVRPLRVGSYNIMAGKSLADFEAGVAALKPRVDVMGLQEIGSNERHRSLLTDRGWGYYRPPATQQDPLLWRRDRFDFLGATGVRLSAQRTVPNAYGAGPVTFDANYANVVRLVERDSGRTVTFVNVHLVHGATQAGRPKPGSRALFDLYADQVRALAPAVAAEKATSDAVYVMGDFNIGYAADAKWHRKAMPYHKLTRVGLQAMWRTSSYLGGSVGTHGTQLIDQVWTESAPAKAEIETDIRNSDHRPVIGTYALPTPAATYAPTTGTVGFRQTLVQGDEMDRPYQRPTLRFDLVGDLEHGYAGVRVTDGTGSLGDDFTIDDSSLYDNDLSESYVLVQIVPNQSRNVDKTFVLDLVDPVNTAITLGKGTAAGLIRDDD